MKTTKATKATKFEEKINYAIANGDKIEERFLGSIVPSRKELAEMDRHADKEQAKAEKNADSKNVGLKKAVVDGEVRYYKNKNLFKTVRGNWFEIRKDGYQYAVPKSRYAELNLV